MEDSKWHTSPPDPLSLKRWGATRTNTPPLFKERGLGGEVCGLILSGGQSSRMGEEKRLINYHGKTQEQYLFDFLSNYFSAVYVSINQNQTSDFPYIEDLDLGVKSPMIGIVSAFNHNPDVAWLVVACDMPFVDEKAIEFLLKHRNSEKFATAFENPEISQSKTPLSFGEGQGRPTLRVRYFPEPLLTIYEPKIFPKLQEAINQGKKSPMKVLQNLEIELLQEFDNQWIKNINTPEERAKLLNLED
jgi:molybdenum cofactor guanylyltransferase